MDIIDIQESYVCLLSCIQKTAACVLLRKQRDMYAFCIFLRKISVIHPFQNTSQLGGSSSRPPIGSSPLDHTAWLPSPGYLPLCVNPSPQSYRALTPLHASKRDFHGSYRPRAIGYAKLSPFSAQKHILSCSVHAVVAYRCYIHIDIVLTVYIFVLFFFLFTVGLSRLLR